MSQSPSTIRSPHTTVRLSFNTETVDRTKPTLSIITTSSASLTATTPQTRSTHTSRNASPTATAHILIGGLSNKCLKSLPFGLSIATAVAAHATITTISATILPNAASLELEAPMSEVLVSAW